MYRRMVHRNLIGDSGTRFGASWLESSREVLHGGQRYPVDGLVPRYRANGEGSFCYLLGKHHGQDEWQLNAQCLIDSEGSLRSGMVFVLLGFDPWYG